MKTTPTRRRRRDNSVMESWTTSAEPQVADAPLSVVDVPILTAPPQRAAARDNGADAATRVTGTSTATPAPELDRPTQVGLPALGEMQSVETILAATELLQRLDRLQVELERGVQDAYLVHDYRAACAEIITTFPWLALTKDLDQRLWSSWQRELAALESCLSVAGDAVDSKAQVEKQLRDALYVALSNYSTLIQMLKTASMGANGLDATTALLVHRLSLSHAHVLYALEIHSASASKNWRVPEQYYERARRWGVTQGETHYHLARIVLHDGRFADALYHVMRSRVIDAAFASPGSLADQYVHIASMTSTASSDEASLPSEAACWMQLDRAVLAAAAPYFGQELDFVAQRRAPRALAVALCKLLDAVCHDEASRVIESDTSAAAESLRIVRIVSLFITCACLPKDFVAVSPPTSTDSDFNAVKNNRAIELIVSFVNGLLHRSLGAITSPLRTTKEKEHALQLMLPAINVAFSWLLKVQWRDMVAEATRISCEQLSTMMLTGIIAGGFLAPLEELAPTVGQAKTTASALVEEIEVCGLPCFAGIDGASTLSVDPDAGFEVTDDEALLQSRIGKFLSHVEAFMTPRPAAVAVMASVEPPALTTPATTQVSQQQQQPSPVAEVANGLSQVAINAKGNSTAVATEGRGTVPPTRELWTPAKLTTAASSKNSKPARSASVPKRVAVPEPAPLPPKSDERVVVLDAANIAMRHGLQRRFSCRGIQLCAEFFIAQGNRVVAFLPDYCLDVDADGAFRRRATASSGGRARRREGRCTITPDDRVLVEIMVDSGVVVLTPAMDSDDLYCIQYAKRYNAFLVTNDLFRDHISDTDGPKSRQTELRNWLQARRISYTWVGDEFLPNPNSAYEKLRSGGS